MDMCKICRVPNNYQCLSQTHTRRIWPIASPSRIRTVAPSYCRHPRHNYILTPTARYFPDIKLRIFTRPWLEPSCLFQSIPPLLKSCTTLAPSTGRGSFSIGGLWFSLHVAQSLCLACRLPSGHFGRLHQRVLFQAVASLIGVQWVT